MSNFDNIIQKHPCFSTGAHFNSGRVHLPVSPACNIQCRFCERGFNKTDERPGVSRGLLKPEDCVSFVEKALELCPQISVVGIAGPGDTLATDHALKAFKAIHTAFPNLIKCMSTNGLYLPENTDAIAAAGVETLTVTVNSTNPYVQQHITSYIHYYGKPIIGLEAAQVLIEAQLRGIRRAAELGILIKVNIVLIPGVNDHTIESTVFAVKQAGAQIVNLIPLIPQHDFSDVPPPTCSELNCARALAEKHLKVFRHCKHCRADACGIPGTGKNFSEELYGGLIAGNTFSHG